MTVSKQKRLTRDQAQEIRRRYHELGETQVELARAFGVTQPVIGRIVNNKVHVKDRARSLSNEQVQEIRYLVLTGSTQRAVCEKFNLRPALVSCIIHRKLYASVPLSEKEAALVAEIEKRAGQALDK
jgi:predicted transcriptional regulator